MDETEERTAGLELLTKANAVIEALQRHPHLNVKQIAAAVGEPVSSTYRLVRGLTGVGWVDPSPVRGRFRLGLDLLRLGSLVEDRLDVRRVALPRMRALSAHTGMTCYLLALRGRRAVCVEKVDGTEIRLHGLRIGDSVSLRTDAGAWVLLAHLPEAELQAMRSAAVGADSDEAEEDTARMAEIRALGYAEAAGSVPGVSGIAAPVFNHRGEAEAALVVSGLAAHLEERASEIAEALKEAAAAASEEMGLVVDDG